MSRKPCSSVTPRQREVLRHAARGLSNVEIADLLGLKPRTVKVHLREAYVRLGANGRTHAVTCCYERGIFTVGGVQ
jgi:DNA-binding CsgD family transcriptional regulator